MSAGCTAGPVVRYCGSGSAHTVAAVPVPHATQLPIPRL